MGGDRFVVKKNRIERILEKNSKKVNVRVFDWGKDKQAFVSNFGNKVISKKNESKENSDMNVLGGMSSPKSPNKGSRVSFKLPIQLMNMIDGGKTNKTEIEEPKEKVVNNNLQCLEKGMIQDSLIELIHSPKNNITKEDMHQKQLKLEKLLIEKFNKESNTYNERLRHLKKIKEQEFPEKPLTPLKRLNHSNLEVPRRTTEDIKYEKDYSALDKEIKHTERAIQKKVHGFQHSLKKLQNDIVNEIKQIELNRERQVEHEFNNQDPIIHKPNDKFYNIHTTDLGAFEENLGRIGGKAKLSERTQQFLKKRNSLRDRLVKNKYRNDEAIMNDADVFKIDCIEKIENVFRSCKKVRKKVIREMKSMDGRFGDISDKINFLSCEVDDEIDYTHTHKNDNLLKNEFDNE